LLATACASGTAAPAKPSEPAASKPVSAVTNAPPAAGSGVPAITGSPSASPVAASSPAPAAQQARTVPRIRLEPLAVTFKQPIYLTHAGDGSGRQFVVEKGGTIQVVKGGQVLPTPFLDIKARILAS